jgi:hypothetical protein
MTLPRRRGIQLHAVRDGLFVAAVVVLGFFLFQEWAAARDQPPGGAYDAWIYWQAFRGEA